MGRKADGALAGSLREHEKGEKKRGVTKRWSRAKAGACRRKGKESATAGRVKAEEKGVTRRGHVRRQGRATTRRKHTTKAALFFFCSCDTTKPGVHRLLHRGRDGGQRCLLDGECGERNAANGRHCIRGDGRGRRG